MPRPIAPPIAPPTPPPSPMISSQMQAEKDIATLISDYHHSALEYKTRIVSAQANKSSHQYTEFCLIIAILFSILYLFIKAEELSKSPI